MLAEIVRVVVQLESAWLVARRQASVPRVVNLSATLRATAIYAAGLSVVALSELSRSATSIRHLRRLDEESPENHRAFCDRPLPVNDLRNDPGQSYGLACGGTGYTAVLQVAAARSSTSTTVPHVPKTRTYFGVSLKT